MVIGIHKLIIGRYSVKTYGKDARKGVRSGGRRGRRGEVRFKSSIYAVRWGGE
jgi:hypothetical protein